MVDDSAAFNTPRYTFSIGASTQLFENHSLGGELSYIGERHNIAGYTVVNLNYTATISAFDVFIVVRNLFDQAIINPNITSQSSTMTAQDDQGINGQLGVRYHF